MLKLRLVWVSTFQLTRKCNFGKCRQAKGIWSQKANQVVNVNFSVMYFILMLLDPSPVPPMVNPGFAVMTCKSVNPLSVIIDVSMSLSNA